MSPLSGSTPSGSSSDAPGASTAVRPRDVAVLQVTDVQPMPNPGTREAPYFDGGNASVFLRVFHRACVDRGITEDAAILERIPDYCNTWIGDWMRALSSFVSHDWSAFAKDVRKKFKDRDTEQRVYTRLNLEAFKSIRREWDSKIRGFVREYTAISERVKERGQLDDFTRCLWFLQGLPEKLRNQVMRNLIIDTDELDTFNWEKISTETNRLILIREQSDRLMTMSAASVQHDSYLDPEKLKVLRRDVPLPETREEKMEREIHGLAEQLSALTLMMRGVMPQSDRRMSYGVNTSAQQSNNQQSQQAGGTAAVNQLQGQVSIDCYYCGTPNCQQQRCPTRQQDVSAGKCHTGPDGRM